MTKSALKTLSDSQITNLINEQTAAHRSLMTHTNGASSATSSRLADDIDLLTRELIRRQNSARRAK